MKCFLLQIFDRALLISIQGSHWSRGHFSMLIPTVSLRELRLESETSCSWLRSLTGQRIALVCLWVDVCIVSGGVRVRNRVETGHKSIKTDESPCLLSLRGWYKRKSLPKLSSSATRCSIDPGVARVGWPKRSEQRENAMASRGNYTVFAPPYSKRARCCPASPTQ